MTYYGRWTYKYEEAARQGAAGVILIHETAPASYGWEVVQNSNTNAQFDIVRQNPAAEHTPFESWIQRPLAVAAVPALGARPRAGEGRGAQPGLPADAAQGDALGALCGDAARSSRATTSSESCRARNIPTRRSSTPAHWDHLGIGKPDATGDTHLQWRGRQRRPASPQLIEQARVFAHGPRPERSIVFLAVTAEEKGLLGSEYYATHPLYPPGKTVANLNVDDWLRSRPRRRTSPSAERRSSTWSATWSPPARAQGRYYTPDPHPGDRRVLPLRPFLLRQGRRSGDQLLAGARPGERRDRARRAARRTNTTALHYHQPSDEWRADWDWSGVARECGAAARRRAQAGQLARVAELVRPTANSAPLATRPQPSAPAGLPRPLRPPIRRKRESAVERNARARASGSSGRAGRAADARDLRQEAPDRHRRKLHRRDARRAPHRHRRRGPRLRARLRDLYRTIQG